MYYEENGIYKAFSSYSQDKDGEVVGAAKSSDEVEAIRRSRKDLRREWREYLENKPSDTGKPSIPTLIISAKGNTPRKVIPGTLPPGMTVDEYRQRFGCDPLIIP